MRRNNRQALLVSEARPRRRRSLRRRRAQRDGLLDAPPASTRPRPRARHPQARDRAQTLRADPVRARRIYYGCREDPPPREREGASPGVRPSP